jgi:hypothetical protein
MPVCLVLMAMLMPMALLMPRMLPVLLMLPVLQMLMVLLMLPVLLMPPALLMLPVLQMPMVLLMLPVLLMLTVALPMVRIAFLMPGVRTVLLMLLSMLPSLAPCPSTARMASLTMARPMSIAVARVPVALKAGNALTVTTA